VELYDSADDAVDDHRDAYQASVDKDAARQAAEDDPAAEGYDQARTGRDGGFEAVAQAAGGFRWDAVRTALERAAQYGSREPDGAR
jgi:hypothetical protein